MEVLSLESRSRLAAQGLLERAREPLRFWRHSSEATRRATAHIGKAEVYVRAGNKGGKTWWGAATGLAIAQRLPFLDGIPLPHIRAKRIVGVVLSLDHPQQRWSVQPAYLALLGDWPHKAQMRDGILERLLVQPLGGNDDVSTWSEITFVSQKNLQSGTGARGIHWVHADEPPLQRIWNEFRKAAHAGQKIYKWITATPLVRQQFQWLREEYKREHEGQVYHGRVEFRLRSLYFGPNGELKSDNAALTQDDLQNLYWDYENDDLREARWAGEYVDATADNPYDIPTLLKMRDAWAREPQRWECRIPRELETAEGLKVVGADCVIDVWTPPARGLVGEVIIDPSKGFKSKHHDPALAIVRATANWGDVKEGQILAAYSGYEGSYGMGRLGAVMARQYSEGWVTFENNGGYGEGVARGLRAASYSKIRRQTVELDGRPAVRLGWTTNETTRNAGIAAQQDWIKAFRLGVPYAPCPAVALYDCLTGILIDKHGKAVAGAGMHDEWQTCQGHNLRTLNRPKADPYTIMAQREALGEARAVAAALEPPKEPTIRELLEEQRRSSRGPRAARARRLASPGR